MVFSMIGILFCIYWITDFLFVVVALVVVPVIALCFGGVSISIFAVDNLLMETPIKAKFGKPEQLLQLANRIA